MVSSLAISGTNFEIQSLCHCDLEPNQQNWSKLQHSLILLEIIENQSLVYVWFRERLLHQSLDVSLDPICTSGWESSAPQF